MHDHVFGTTALDVGELALLVPMPFIVWGSDELRRWVVRRRTCARGGRPSVDSRTGIGDGHDARGARAREA